MNQSNRIIGAALSYLLVASAYSQPVSNSQPARAGEAGYVTTDEREKRSKAENDAIWAALEKKIESFELVDVPLKDAISKLLALTAIRNHHVEWQNLIDAGIEREKPISLRLRGVTAGRVLDLLLAEAGGPDIAVVYEPVDGVLLLGTAESIYQRMSIHVYPVGDILNHDLPAMRARTSTTQPADEPLPGESADAARAAEHFRNAMKRLGDAAGDASEDAEAGDVSPRTRKAYRLGRLLELTTQTVHPECWVQNGGTSTLQVFEDCLVVRSNPPVHRELCKLLSDLRTGILETPAESRQRRQRP